MATDDPARALVALCKEVERIADNIEDQCREPDKTLCNVLSLRRAVTAARVETDD